MIFFVTILVGFCIVYITRPEPELIIKLPDKNNASDITYIDDNGVCYKYEPVSAQCDMCDAKICKK